MCVVFLRGCTRSSGARGAAAARSRTKLTASGVAVWVGAADERRAVWRRAARGSSGGVGVKPLPLLAAAAVERRRLCSSSRLGRRCRRRRRRLGRARVVGADRRCAGRARHTVDATLARCRLRGPNGGECFVVSLACCSRRRAARQVGIKSLHTCRQPQRRRDRV